MELLTNRINDFMQLDQSARQVVTEQESTPPLDSGTPSLLPDVVEISAEGQRKADSEGGAKSLWQDLHKLSTNKQELFPAEQASAEQGAIDAAIKRLEKQIRELQQRMEPLIGKEDEASQKQLEQLEAELFGLTTQLMEFHNKKLQQLKNQ